MFSPLTEDAQQAVVGHGFAAEAEKSKLKGPLRACGV